MHYDPSPTHFMCITKLQPHILLAHYKNYNPSPTYFLCITKITTHQPRTFCALQKLRPVTPLLLAQYDPPLLSAHYAPPPTTSPTPPPLLFAQYDLEDGVRARRVVVGGRLAGRARHVAVLDECEHVVDARHLLLAQPAHLHLLVAVLEHPQLLLLVQQVEHLPGGRVAAATVRLRL